MSRRGEFRTLRTIERDGLFVTTDLAVAVLSATHFDFAVCNLNARQANGSRVIGANLFPIDGQAAIEIVDGEERVGSKNGQKEYVSNCGFDRKIEFRRRNCTK